MPEAKTPPPFESLSRKDAQFVQVKQYTRGRLIHFLESHRSILAPEGTTYSFNVRIRPRSILEFGMSVHPSILAQYPKGVVYAVDVRDEKGTVRRVFSKRMKRSRILEWSHALRESWSIAYKYIDFWKEARIDLSEYSGQNVLITFALSGERKRNPWNLEKQQKRAGTDLYLFAAIGDPVLFAPAEGESDQNTNLIFCFLDALRPDALGCYGYARKVSPNIDRLAAGGVLFEQAFAPTNFTRGTISSVFTGKRPGLLGVPLQRWNLNAFEKWSFRRLAEDSLPNLLRKRGYVTRMIGSNPFIMESVPFGVDIGFERLESFNVRKWDTETITGHALDFIKENASRPFLLYLHYNNNHGPHRPPTRYRHIWEERIPDDPRTWPPKYDGETAYVDEQMDILYRALENKGLAKNTLLVITADHGREYEKGHPKGHAKSLYDPEWHVPLIIVQPGRMPPGRRVGKMVSLMDLYPSVCELLGMPAGKETDGMSLLPLIDAKRGKPRKLLYMESGEAMGLRTIGYKYIAKETPYHSVIGPKASDGGYLTEFYDLLNDPGETRNLIREDPERAAALLNLAWHHKQKIDRRRHQIATEMERRKGLLFDDSLSLYADYFYGRHVMHLVTSQAGRNLTGVIRVNGYIDYYVPYMIEAGDDFHLHAERDVLELNLVSESDLDGIEFTVFPPGAEFSMELLLDGRPLDPNMLYLGPYSLACKDLPFAVGGPVDVRLLRAEQPPFYHPGKETGLFLWTRAQSPGAGQEAMVGQVKNALKAWGYIR